MLSNCNLKILNRTLTELPMLQVKSINTFYGKSHILHDVSLDVENGEVTCLLGRNGSGKTTTLKTIAGTLSPNSGSIVFKGQDLTGWPAYRVVRQGIALVPEDRRIFPDLTVLENLKLAERKSKNQGQFWSFNRVFHYFPNLAERKANSGSKLSGGEQQMLAIARALMGNPELLMLDEPTEGLAPLIVEAVVWIIQELKREGITILLVEQNAEVALSLADKVYVLGKGEINFQGPAGLLKENDELKKKYLGV